MTRFVDKYRPKKLRAVVGQRAAVASLDGLLRTNKVLGNTILISGPYGAGKTTLARILARAANCLEPNNFEACGKCASCKIKIKYHPDIAEINAADSRGIDEVRRIIDTSKLSPKYKGRIFILDELHQLTPQASQAFLKELEEPPSHVSYILCTTDPWSLLPTIRSRSTHVKVSEVRPGDLVSLLGKVSKKEGLPLLPEVLQYIAELSGGHVRDALTLLEKLVASSPTASLEEAQDVLPALAEQILGSSPTALVPKYVEKLLSGTIHGMVYYRKVDNPEYFLTLILAFLKEYIVYNVDSRMTDDKSLESFHKNQMKGSRLSHSSLIEVYEFHLLALEKIRQRVLDPLDACDLAILKSLNSMK